MPEGEEYAVSESEGEPTESVEGDLAAVEVETATGVGGTTDDLASTESALATPELGTAGDELARDVPVEADDALYETPTDSFETPAQSYSDDVPLGACDVAAAELRVRGTGLGRDRSDGADLRNRTDLPRCSTECPEAGGWPGPTGGDAADMVADAVASFQEQQWEGRVRRGPVRSGFLDDSRLTNRRLRRHCWTGNG